MTELNLLLPSGGIARFAWDLVWQSTLVGIVALMLLRFFVKRPARRAWFATLAVGLCMAIPLVSLAARARGLGLLRSEPQTVARPQAAAVIPAGPSARTAASEAASDAGIGPVESNKEANGSVGLSLAFVAEADLTPSRSSRAVSFDGASLWTCMIVAATAVWAVLAITAVVRLINGIASVYRLCREAVECDDNRIVSSCARAARAMGLQRAPQVAVSARTSCPTVLAWGRPKLFIPPLAGEKSDQQWFSVFAHELAHVQRGDGWSQLLMEVALVLLPWQPLVRLLRGEHRQACEEACDDWALSAGADPVELASVLTEWIPSEANLAVLGIGNGTSSVRKRIERLLKVSSPPQPRLGGGWLLGSVSTAACVLCFLTLLQTGSLASRTGDHPEAIPPSAAGAADGWDSDKPARLTEEETHAPKWLVAVLGEGRMRHWNSAMVLGFGPQHQTLFSHGRDDVLKVWDLETGNELRQLQLPLSVGGYRWWDWEIETRRRYYIDLLLSSDGNVLFLGKADGTVELLDATTFELLRILKIPGELPKKIAMSADGKRLAALRLTNADGMCAAIVLDIATGTTVGSIEQKIPDELSRTMSAPWRWLELSPDGSQLAVSRNGDATLWDVATGELLHEFDGGWNLRFSPDGDTLVAHTSDQQLNLWDVATGQLRSSIRSFATRSQVAFDPAGNLLAIVDGDRVRLCRVATGEQLWMSNEYNPSRHFSEPTVVFHKNGNLLAISSGHRVALFDAASGNEVGRDRTPALTALAVDPTGGQLVTGDSNGQLTVWGVADGERRRAWLGHDHGVSPVVFSPDGRSLASAAFEHVVVWNGASQTLRDTVQPKRAQRGSNAVPLQMAFTPDSTSLLVGNRPYELHVWRVGSGSLDEILQFDPKPLLSFPFAVAEKDALIAYSTAEPRGLRVWSLKTGKQAAMLPCDGGRMPLTVSADGRRIAVGTRGDKISVWDLELDEQIDLVKGHSHRFLHALAISPNGRLLASGAEDGKVQLWNCTTGSKVETMHIGPPSGIIDQLAFSTDGRHLITRNGNGTAFVLRVDSELLALD